MIKGFAEKAAAYQRLAAQAKDFSIKSNYLDQAQRCREFAHSLQCRIRLVTPEEVGDPHATSRAPAPCHPLPKAFQPSGPRQTPDRWRPWRDVAPGSK